MKRIFFILWILSFLISFQGNCQKTWGAPLGQYANNPAGAAMNDLGEISTCYYNNFGSAYNNPIGLLLMGSAPLPIDNAGVGFRMTSESGGIIKSNMAEGTFIYRIPVGKSSKLAFGLSGVVNQLGLMRDRINAQYPSDPVLQGAQSGFWGDANFGLSMYSANKYYIGAAVYNILQQSTDWLVPGFVSRNSRLLTCSGMYSINVLSGDGKIEFTGVGQTYLSGGSNNFLYDVTGRIILKKVFWVGGGYLPGCVKILLGAYYQNFAIGYSCGMDNGGISKYTYTVPRHELFLKVDFNNSKTSHSHTEKK